MFPLALGTNESFAPYLSDEALMSSNVKLISIVLTLAIFVLQLSVHATWAIIVSAILPAAAHLKMVDPRVGSRRKAS
jgi:hypothetical protein